MDVSPEALVDAIEAVTGTHPGHRRAHASGVVATGTFTPGPGPTAFPTPGAKPATDHDPTSAGPTGQDSAVWREPGVSR